MTNFNKIGKNRRLLKEIQGHMRLKTPANSDAIRLEYLSTLWKRLVQPLNESSENVQEVIDFMDANYLTRDDWTSITELGLADCAVENVKLDTKTKSAFTRIYNAASHPMPFMKASAVFATKGAKKEQADFEDVIEASDDDIAPEEKEALDEEAGGEEALKKDKYVTKPKKKAAPKKAAAKRKAKDEDEDDEDDEDIKPPKKKTASAGRGRGRGRGRGH
jgi:replication factor C subunit 1